MTEVTFDHLALSVRTLAHVRDVLCEVLPPTVGIELREAVERGEITELMTARDLENAEGFQWTVSFGARGFLLEVAPEHGGEMTVSDVKKLEKKLKLPRRPYPRLLVVPEGSDPEVQSRVWEGMENGDWSKGLQ